MTIFTQDFEWEEDNPEIDCFRAEADIEDFENFLELKTVDEDGNTVPLTDSVVMSRPDAYRLMKFIQETLDK